MIVRELVEKLLKEDQEALVTMDYGGSHKGMRAYSNINDVTTDSVLSIDNPGEKYYNVVVIE